jgi:hypothetical protein
MIVYPNTDYDSWITQDDADDYFETRLNSSEWNSEEIALQTAFRSLNELDYNLVFKTDKTLSDAYYTATQITEILTALKQAQCEQALHEIKNDPAGQAIERVNLGGLLSISLPKKKAKEPPRYAQRAIAMLRPYIKAPTVTRTR